MPPCRVAGNYLPKQVIISRRRTVVEKYVHNEVHRMLRSHLARHRLGNDDCILLRCVIEFTSSDTKRLYIGWLYVRSNSRHQIVTALVVDRLGNNFILGRDRQISVCDRIRVINY